MLWCKGARGLPSERRFRQRIQSLLETVKRRGTLSGMTARCRSGSIKKTDDPFLPGCVRQALAGERLSLQLWLLIDASK